MLSSDFFLKIWTQELQVESTLVMLRIEVKMLLDFVLSNLLLPSFEDHIIAMDFCKEFVCCQVFMSCKGFTLLNTSPLLNTALSSAGVAAMSDF